MFGLPRVLLSDHDPKFASDLFRKVHERMGVDQRLGTPYHYRSFGAMRAVRRAQKAKSAQTSNCAPAARQAATRHPPAAGGADQLEPGCGSRGGLGHLGEPRRRVRVGKRSDIMRGVV